MVPGVLSQRGENVTTEDLATLKDGDCVHVDAVPGYSTGGGYEAHVFSVKPMGAFVRKAKASPWTDDALDFRTARELTRI